MSIRTTITLEEELLEQVKEQSRLRGISFRETLNDLLRIALIRVKEKPQRRNLEIRPVSMGYRPGVKYDSVAAMLEYGEGEEHR